MDSFRLVATSSKGRQGAGARGRRNHWIAAAALAALALLVTPQRAMAAGRVALVMVAEDYQKFAASSIGVKRANEIAEALQAKGFNVILEANPVNARARAALLDVSQQVNGADLALAFLIGHVIAVHGESYFLPVNTELGVATDIFSRGISISSVARIMAKAKAGAVIVLMTTPNFKTDIADVESRPQYVAENPKSVVTVFSSSAKLPMSRIDEASAQAADAVVTLLRRPAPSLAELVKAASAEVGEVFGAPADVSLAKPSPPPDVAGPGAPATAPSVPEPESKPPESKALAKAQAEAEKAPPPALARPVDESQLGKRQRERIQQRLRDLSLYTGPIDSVMGRLTREAIMGYQRSKGAEVTGYLTPEQFQALLPEGN